MLLRVIDLDGSVAGQDPLRRRIDAGAAACIDAADLAPSLRILASRAAMARFRNRVRASAAGEEPCLTFYGSGDFHHLTAGLLAEVGRDLSVIHFDNHPDWVDFPSTFNCGAWVNRALELPHVKRVVTLGPCSDDLVRPELQFANLPALSDGRIELHPWQHAPSRVWRRYRDGAGHRQEGGHLHWRNLADEPNWTAFLDELVAGLPTKAIWITIDKDVLGTQDAVTNWDQGKLPLDWLLGAIDHLGASCEIVGADVCGDYSPPVFADPVRATLAWFDHPGAISPSPAQLATNARVNDRLIARFEGALS